MYGHCRTSEHAAHFGGHFGHHKFQGFAGFGGGFRRPKYNVPTNVVKTETAFEIHIYALGFDKENIKLSVLGSSLHVSGTKNIEEGSEPHFIRQEFPIKSFERAFELGNSIDKNLISAKQENGVLIITLPIKPEAQPQGIKVE